MAMAIVALAAIQTGKLCLLATFPANPVSIVRRFYTSGTLPNERRTNHKRSSFLCLFVIFIVPFVVRSPSIARRSHVHRSNSRIDPDCRHDCRTTAAGPTGPTGPTGRTAGSGRTGARELHAGDCRASEEARGWRPVDGARHERR